MSRVEKREAWAGLFFLSPWLIGFLLFTVGPIIASFIFSLTEYDVIHEAKFVGIENYANIIGFHNVEGGLTANDPLFWKSLWNTLYIATIGVPLSLILGLAIAMLLNEETKAIRWYRLIYYLPAIVPVVAIAVLWQWIYRPQIGLLDMVFQWFGIAMPNWLADPVWTKPALIILLLWGVGGNMVVWLAGLKAIPQQLYEAAEIDGAGWWQRFRRVTIPILTPYIFFNLIIGIINYFQIFTQAYLLGTSEYTAGPLDSLLFYVYYIFNRAFLYFDMGYASALAWILFIIILALTLVQLKLAPKWVYYEGEKKG
jgi:multiple sugar transport system permease protein